MRSRDGIHSGEKGEKKVKQVGVITRAQGTLTGLELFPGKRLEEVCKEGGGGDEFESRNKIFIFVSISSKMGLKVGNRKCSYCLLVGLVVKHRVRNYLARSII